MPFVFFHWRIKIHFTHIHMLQRTGLVLTVLRASAVLNDTNKNWNRITSTFFTFRSLWNILHFALCIFYNLPFSSLSLSLRSGFRTILFCDLDFHFVCQTFYYSHYGVDKFASRTSGSWTMKIAFKWLHFFLYFVPDSVFSSLYSSHPFWFILLHRISYTLKPSICLFVGRFKKYSDPLTTNIFVFQFLLCARCLSGHQVLCNLNKIDFTFKSDSSRMFWYAAYTDFGLEASPFFSSLALLYFNCWIDILKFIEIFASSHSLNNTFD